MTPDNNTRRHWRQAVDRLEIRELLDHHQIAVDAGDAEAYAALYAVDGSYESQFGQARGRQAIVEMSERLTTSGFTRGKRHFSGAARIEVDGDRASAVSYWWVAETENFPPVIVSTGLYDDEFVRTDESWRILRRRQRIDPNWLFGRDAPSTG